MATRNILNTVAIAALVVVFVVLARLAPHPANLTPLLSVALFSGFFLPRKYAWWVPLSAIVISDLFLGLHSLILFTWGSFALIALLGSGHFKKNISFHSTVGLSVIGAVLFFVVTNFGVWAEGRLYATTLEGLIQCYYNALPFFRNTLIGSLAYSTVFYAAYSLVLNIDSFKNMAFSRQRL